MASIAAAGAGAATGSLEIGIAGAGTAGLATAFALARAGHRVTVFEKHPHLSSLGAGLPKEGPPLVRGLEGNQERPQLGSE